jgi:hypothetical protein
LGEWLSSANGFNLSNPYNKRLKRLIDFTSSLLFFITFPIHFVFVKRPLRFFSNCFSVLIGRKTWVGYAIAEKELPVLKPAILFSNGHPAGNRLSLNEEGLKIIDHWYAKDYQPVRDLRIIWRSYSHLGGKG